MLFSTQCVMWSRTEVGKPAVSVGVGEQITLTFSIFPLMSKWTDLEVSIDEPFPILSCFVVGDTKG